MTAYKHGGYSDDLILAAICDQHRRLVGRGSHSFTLELNLSNSRIHS